MTLDGIPERLPPVAETAERLPFAATAERSRTRRRGVPSASEKPGGDDDGDAEDKHVLNDLA